jgi:hypothetical protein
MCEPNPQPCMHGPKIDGLKAAAIDVIQAIVDPNNPNLTRIALVPYSAAVNVSGYHDQASGGDSADGCVMERLYAPRDTDEAPGSGGGGSSRNFAVKGQLNEPSNGRYICPSARSARRHSGPYWSCLGLEYTLAKLELDFFRRQRACPVWQSECHQGHAADDGRHVQYVLQRRCR